MRTGTATAIAIGIMVVVIPIHIADTTKAVLAASDSATAVPAHCHHCHVRSPISGVVVDKDTVAADAPVASLLLPSGATYPTAAAMMKNLNHTGAKATATTTGTVSVTASAVMAETAVATEKEECDGC